MVWLRRTGFHIGIAAAWLLCLAGNTHAQAMALDPQLPAYRATQLQPDTLHFGRADTMDGLLHAWAKNFQRIYPHLQLYLHNDTRLSAEAFDALIDGSSDVAPFVRELFPAEIARFQQKFGYPPTLIAVATGSYATPGGTHALAIYVNAANPIKQLTLQQLDAIYSSTRRRGSTNEIQTWGDVGAQGEWADKPINLYGMLQRRGTGNPPGIVNFFTQRVLLGGEFKTRVQQELDAPDLGSLDAIVHAVADDPYGIGYSGFANRIGGVNSLALSESATDPFYQGSLEEVAKRVYPLTRTVYLCIRRAPGQPLRPALREFLRYALSRDGQLAVANDRSKFMPFSAAQAAAQLRLLE